MKKPAATMPPSVEWDFTRVDDSALQSATLYEYARSSDKLRNAVSKCLQTKIKGKRISEYILAALITERKTRKPYPDCFPAGVYRKVSADLINATGGNFKLRHIIMHQRPDFPAPWMSFPLKFKPNENFSRIICTPMNHVFKHVEELAIESGDALKQLEYEEKTNTGRFQISFLPLHGSTIKDIVGDFEKWLREEIKQHPDNYSAMKGKGRKGQLPIPRLAWLAAYRIHKAGVTFDDAQIKLEKESNYYGHLPKYSEKSAWSDAIKKAKQFLAKVESGQI
jgi:hypothetical protein